MSAQLSLIIQSADKTHKAKIKILDQVTIEQLIDKTQEQWNLPHDARYGVRLERTNEQLDFSASLDDAGVQDGDHLEIFPIIEAG